MAETNELDWGKAPAEGPIDPHVYDPEKEEPADMGELDYDYSSIEEKIKAGFREKEKGNKLFKNGEYEKAWKQYDRCFVHIYTSKEEWAAIGDAGHDEINQFKLPCHLNRGLCRLKENDLTNALWDFTEALRIEPDHGKGLYRKGMTLIGMVRNDLAKEGTGELWDLDVAEQRVEEARINLMQAVKLVPNDVNIRNALAEQKDVKEALMQHRKKYRADQKKLYSTFISNLDKDNRRLQDVEGNTDVFDDMPMLERVRIDSN